MRIRFLTVMPSKGYSGGRMLALTMAEALADQGANVDIITNEVPEMHEEFRNVTKIKFIKSSLINLSPYVARDIDIVVIIPHMGDISTHSEFVRHGIECNAKIILLNFETPNWFNEVSPFKRDEKEWAGWKVIVPYADLILSITEIGNKYAMDYFQNVKHDCVFDYCYPGINSFLADQVAAPPVKENNILMITRYDRHKGFDLLYPFMDEAFEGYTIQVILGNGHLSNVWLDEWKGRFRKYKVGVEVYQSVSSIRKYALIKSAKLLYFPTRFEGFGIPPLEAGYCLTPSVCSDLPVLREWGGHAFIYADPLNTSEMKEALLRALSEPESFQKEQRRIREIADFQSFGRRLMKLLRERL